MRTSERHRCCVAVAVIYVQEEEARASGGEVVERGARSTEERDFNSFCVKLEAQRLVKAPEHGVACLCGNLNSWSN